MAHMRFSCKAETTSFQSSYVQDLQNRLTSDNQSEQSYQKVCRNVYSIISSHGLHIKLQSLRVMRWEQGPGLCL